MVKNDLRNPPVFNVLTCKTATPAEGGKFLKNMVSKRVFLSDFKHNLASKRPHIHINFFTLSKSGPFVRRGGGTRAPSAPPQPTALAYVLKLF